MPQHILSNIIRIAIILEAAFQNLKYNKKKWSAAADDADDGDADSSALSESRQTWIWTKNDIRDVCSTADLVLVPTGTHWYPLVPTSIHWKPLVHKEKG